LACAGPGTRGARGGGGGGKSIFGAPTRHDARDRLRSRAWATIASGCRNLFGSTPNPSIAKGRGALVFDLFSPAIGLVQVTAICRASLGAAAMRPCVSGFLRGPAIPTCLGGRKTPASKEQKRQEQQRMPTRRWVQAAGTDRAPLISTASRVSIASPNPRSFAYHVKRGSPSPLFRPK